MPLNVLHCEAERDSSICMNRVATHSWLFLNVAKAWTVGWALVWQGGHAGVCNAGNWTVGPARLPAWPPL